MIEWLRNNWKKRWFRITVLSLGILMAIVVMLPCALYIPAVQEYARKVVVEKVSETTDYKVEIGRVLLKFPIKLGVDDFLVLDAKNDTMVAGKHAAVDVRVLPLLMGDVVVRGIDADHAVYKMASADSSMTLSAKVDHVRLNKTTIELLTDKISLSDAVIDGADVVLSMDVRKAKPEPADTASSAAWLIDLGKLSLTNTRYRMKMMPEIDSLDVAIGNCALENIAVNLSVGTVKSGYLGVDSLSAAYFLPTGDDAKRFMANYTPLTDSLPDKSKSREWTIFSDSIRVRNSSAVYATKGVTPSDGLDFGNIAVSDLNLAIDRFYNRGAKMRVPISNISAKERSGLDLKKISGLFAMDEKSISVDSLRIETLLSEIKLNAKVDNTLFSGNKDAIADVALVSSISLEEVGKVFPFSRPMLRSISRTENARSEIIIKGNGEALDIEKCDLVVPHIVDLAVNGKVKDLYDSKKMSGKASLSGKLTGGNALRGMIGLDKSMRIPYVNIKGKATYDKSRIGADFSALIEGGKIVAGGYWRSNRESYNGKIEVKDFDARSIMPKGEVGIVDGSVAVAGRGYDLYGMDAKLSTVINRVEYRNVDYGNISLEGSLNKGKYDLGVSSQNEFASMNMVLDGRISKDSYSANIDGSVFNVNLAAMQLSDTNLEGGFDIKAELAANLKKQYYLGLVKVSDIDIDYGENDFQTDSINLGFFSNERNTNFRLRNDDMLVTMQSPHSLGDWQKSLADLSGMVDSVFMNQKVDIRRLKEILPTFHAEIGASTDNIAYQYLSTTDIKYDKVDLKISKEEDLDIESSLVRLVVGDVVVDTISIGGNTIADSLVYNLHVGNTPGNSALLKSADLGGMLHGNQASLYITQVDNAGERGFDFGLNLSVADSVARMEIYPENPVIAFKQWSIARDNYISYNMNNMAVRADLDVRSGNASHIRIYTDNPPADNNGINVDLAGIDIKEWLTLSPFSPPIEGMLSSKFKIFYNDKYVWGDGKVGVDGLYYGKNRVGDIGLDSKVAYIGENQSVYAMMNMDLDGRKIADVHGSMKDTLSHTNYNMKINFNRFPLSVANAFVPDGMTKADGYMYVDMDFQGTIENPDIKGYLRFDSTRVVMPTFGARFDFDTVPVTIEDGHVKFNKFDLYGANGKPVTIDGSLRFMPAGSLYTNLNISGRNVQFVDSKKTGKSELYGKGYADLNAKIKGYLKELDVNASLSVLSGTNLTYVMQSEASSVAQSGSDDVVTFVQFNDTVPHISDAAEEQRSFAMKVNANLTLQPNALFTINLSPDGKNKVQIDGDGTLNYSQNYQGDMRMTGRYVINGGFVRYSPPMLSEKLFNFVEGSNISWTGDILNPSLDIKAVETIKANVTSNQNSRLVPFEVALNVGNTLSRLDVSFDLSTDADMTIANELSGMTKEQRSTQAMNMLLYGSYTGASTTTNSNMSGESMAYSFLESTLNKWAANSISGVDLSFGINQYDQTVDGTTSTTTNYSYQVSKSVFDDRFKIVVGGNYSTDASARDNLSQNLVNDLSFEYKLNKAGTAYVKLFRHTEYESILEGEITETGGGFVWKRKIASWKDMFRVFRKLKRRKKVAQRREVVAPVDSVEFKNETDD